jgi:hypothetical protein
MEYLRQTIGSAELDGIFDLPPQLRNRRVEVIILPADSLVAEPNEPKRKRQLGFWDGPELPDSFFEPLPDEDLQAWGL